MEPDISSLNMKQVLSFDGFFVEQLKAIYEDSFPANERTDFDQIIQELNAGKKVLYIAEDAAGILCAFFLMMPLLPERIYFGEYLAIKKGLRNRGLGGKFLQFIFRSLKEKGESGFVLEADDPDDEDATDRSLCRRRIEFYRRNGPRIVECAPRYVMPDLAGEGVLRMKLMWMPLDAEAGELAGPRLISCVTQIYSQAYGRDRDDPLLKSTLDNLVC